MTGETRLEGCLVRERVSWESLAHALGEVLGVAPEAVALFDVDHLRPPPPVRVEIQERESGFRMDLTLYLGSEIHTPLTGISLASRLAMALRQEVLTSPPAEGEMASSPASWILARPDGRLYWVQQTHPESEAVEIDWSPGAMRPWTPPPRN